MINHFLSYKYRIVKLSEDKWRVQNKHKYSFNWGYLACDGQLDFDTYEEAVKACAKQEIVRQNNSSAQFGFTPQQLPYLLGEDTTDA